MIKDSSLKLKTKGTFTTCMRNGKRSVSYIRSNHRLQCPASSPQLPQSHLHPTGNKAERRGREIAPGRQPHSLLPRMGSRPLASLLVEDGFRECLCFQGMRPLAAEDSNLTQRLLQDGAGFHPIDVFLFHFASSKKYMKPARGREVQVC